MHNPTKKLLLSAFTLSLILTGCSSNEDTPETQGTQSIMFKSATSQYSGIEIFKGLYFMEGAFAKAIPALAEQQANLPVLTPEQQAKFGDFQNEIIALIAAEDPYYFDDFKKSMQSQDLYQLRDSYAAGISKIRSIGLTSQNLKSFFSFANLFESKQVDLDRADIQALDLSLQADFDTFVSILENDYGISYDNLTGFGGTMIVSANDAVFAHQQNAAYQKNYAANTATMFNKVRWITWLEDQYMASDVLVLQISEAL